MLHDMQLIYNTFVFVQHMCHSMHLNQVHGIQVALDAANEAFNTSAGRLRKLYAIEKLSGNLSLTRQEQQKTSLSDLS